MSTETTTAMDINTWIDSKERPPITLCISGHTIRLSQPTDKVHVTVTPPVIYHLWSLWPFKPTNDLLREYVIDTEEYETAGELINGLGRIMAALAWEVEATW